MFIKNIKISLQKIMEDMNTNDDTFITNYEPNK